MMARLQALRRPRAQAWLAAALLAVLSVVQYAGTLDNDFVWDARDVFLNDPSIREGGHLAEYFSEGMFAAVGMEGERFAYLDYYRPLVKLLHRAEYAAFGTDPTGYNAVNIGLNALVVVAAFFLVRALTGDPRLALAACALYAVNPARVEAVAWAYSDSYLLFSLFALLALLAYHRRRPAMALGAYALALLSQESAVLLPLVLVLYHALWRGDRRWRDYLPLLAFIALTVAFLLLRRAAVGPTPLTGLPLTSLLNGAVHILAESVRAVFVPQSGISIYRYRPGMFAQLTPALVGDWLFAAGLLLFAVWLWRRARLALFWFLWFFVWMAVIFNLGQYAEYYFMDKILYLGALGFCVLLAQALLGGRFLPRWGLSRRWGVGLLAGLLLAHFATTLWRTGFYADEERYFLAAAHADPDFALMQYALGSLYRERGDLARAGEAFSRATVLEPDHSFAWNNLGNIHFLQGDYDAAVRAWKRAIEADPKNPQPYYNVGIALERLGRREEALDYYRQYLRLEPHPPAGVRAQVRRLEGARR